MKTILITGGTSGLGYRTAYILAHESENKIILIGSNNKKGQQAVERLIYETENKNLRFIKADLSSINEIKLLAKDLNKEKIDILINNAGALFYSRNESIDQIEKTFALNHLSYFALTNLLLKYKVIKNGGRIINVASGAHRGIDVDFNDLEMSNNYNGWKCYKISKLCNILFTKKLSELTSINNITVNCLHPGFVKTEFGKNNKGVISLAIKLLMNFFAITVEEGAKTIIHLANSEDVKDITGKYYYKSKIKQPSQYAENKSSADQLWNKSIEMLKNKGLTL
jgi:retinol dehydrogenase-12